VAAIKLTGTLKVGDTVHILGTSTDFHESVASMQIERDAVHEATAGQEIGIKVAERVREGDTVYRVEE
jgi:putative protease